ncbi:MAG: DUF11 domain-containing protein, partial [Burkholderiaceae bacterium]
MCLALLCLSALFPVAAVAQTQVVNTARVAPPVSVTNSNPSVSCTAGVCEAAVTNDVTPSANLAITKTTTAVNATVGATISYVIVIANNGPSNALNITVTDALPAGTLSFNSISGSAGLSFVSNTNSFTATLASLATGTSATITLVVNVLAAPSSGVITNTAAVTSTVADPIPANNTSTSTVTAVLSADLRISKVASVSVGTVGSTFSYAISFVNNGPSAASEITITDAISS